MRGTIALQRFIRMANRFSGFLVNANICTTFTFPLQQLRF